MAPSTKLKAKARHPTQSSLNHSLVGLPNYAYPTPPSHRSALAENSEIMSAEEQRARALLDLSIALVDAALDVLEKHVRTDEQLRKESLLMPGGTVGKHFRHVIEMFQAFLLPLLSPRIADPPFPSSSSFASSSRSDIEINYDAILPSSRHNIARSLSSCRGAMRDIRDGLIRWEEVVRARSPAAPSVADMGGGASDSDTNGAIAVGRGVAGETRLGGLAEEMQRIVRLVAVTPTQQYMESSVGRELWFCSLHAIHHFSMLRTIAVHELVNCET